MSPNIIGYHESITREFEILKDRIKKLVPHALTQGEGKEAILRAILRRHLPETIKIGRGFIITRIESSSQLDVLVLQQDKPTLFQDGDLFIVTPDVPGAIIEVKSKIRGSKQWRKVCEKLFQTGSMCINIGNNRIWSGIFTYNGNRRQIKHALDALYQLYINRKGVINCITIGSNYFIRFWDKGEQEVGDSEEESNKRRFRAYELTNLSYSYFIGNLIDAMCNIDKHKTGYTWFAFEQGKRKNGRLIDERIIE